MKTETLTRNIWWAACKTEDSVEGGSVGTFDTREEAEAYAQKEGWEFVAREVVVSDEATEAADIEKADVYRVGGPLVCTRHFEPDLTPLAGPLKGKYVPASEWPGHARHKTNMATGHQGDPLADWNSRQLSATPKPSLYTN